MSKILTPDQILQQWYSDLPISVTRSLGHVLGFGTLGGTGLLGTYPKDQHVEHSWWRLHGLNVSAGLPEAPFELSLEAGVSFFATTLDLLRPMARKYAHKLPIVAKINSSSPLTGGVQVYFGTVQDAFNAGAVGIGITVNPGSPLFPQQMVEAVKIREQAHALGMFLVVWAYSRGWQVKEGQKPEDIFTALDVTAMDLTLAAQFADIIKVKLPGTVVNGMEKHDMLDDAQFQTLEAKLAHLKMVCPNKLIVFSGGDVSADDPNDEKYVAGLAEISKAGLAGFIMGRKVTKKPREKALELMQRAMASLRSSLPAAA